MQMQDEIHQMRTINDSKLLKPGEKNKFVIYISFYCSNVNA